MTGKHEAEAIAYSTMLSSLISSTVISNGFIDGKATVHKPYLMGELFAFLPL